MKALIQGWVNYFSIANAKTIMQQLDERLRTRLRMGLLKEWKTCKTRIKNLQQLKVSKQKAYEWGNSSLGYCRVALRPILCTTPNNTYFKSQGYEGFAATYKRVIEATQTTLL